jgi:exosortase/archaeosortase family protein
VGRWPVTSEVNVGSVRRSGARRHLPSLDFQLPSTLHTAQHYRRARTGPVAGLLMYGMAFWLAVANDTFRQLEVRAIKPVADLATGLNGTQATKTVIFFGLGKPGAFGLNLTVECTSALLLIPLLVMMGSFAIFTRLSLRRQLTALFVGAFLILSVNALRVGIIAWATWKYGYDPGYKLSHVFVGSAFSLVGFVGAMLVALWILVRTERTKNSGEPAAQSANADVADAPTTVFRAITPDDAPTTVLRPVNVTDAPAHRSTDGHRPRVQVSRRTGARHRR